MGKATRIRQQNARTGNEAMALVDAKLGEGA